MWKTRAINSLRENRGFTKATLPLLTPIRRGAQWLDREISRKFKLNGGTVCYDNVRLRFPTDIGVGFSSGIHWHGTDGFEPNTWRVLRHYLDGASHFLDVGSNIGFYSVLAKLIAPEIVVDAFEPVPAIAEKNRLFHAANGLDASRVREAALSDRDGVGTIYLPLSESSKDEETTATIRTDSWQARKQHQEISVALLTLDMFAAKNAVAKPLVLKIDVEDHEAAVLTGGRRVIEAARPVMVVEMLPRAHGNGETLLRIDELRYVAFAITASGLFRFGNADFGQVRTFTDFLLLPEEMVDRGRSFATFDAMGSLHR